MGSIISYRVDMDNYTKYSEDHLGTDNDDLKRNAEFDTLTNRGICKFVKRSFKYQAFYHSHNKGGVTCPI